MWLNGLERGKHLGLYTVDSFIKEAATFEEKRTYRKGLSFYRIAAKLKVKNIAPLFFASLPTHNTHAHN